jgi:hypothetical protein
VVQVDRISLSGFDIIYLGLDLSADLSCKVRSRTEDGRWSRLRFWSVEVGSCTTKTGL